MSTAVYFPTASHARTHSHTCIESACSALISRRPPGRTNRSNERVQRYATIATNERRSLCARIDGAGHRQTHFLLPFSGGEIIYIADVGKKQSAGGSQVNFPTSDVPNEVVPRAGGPAVATTRVSTSSERERELG
jgi:hypothetical protein